MPTVSFVDVRYNTDVPGRIINATDVDGVTQYQSSPTADDDLVKQVCNKIIANVDTGAAIHVTVNGNVIVKDPPAASALAPAAPPPTAALSANAATLANKLAVLQDRIADHLTKREAALASREDAVAQREAALDNSAGPVRKKSTRRGRAK